MIESVMDSMTESVFNLRLWQSLFLVKLQLFTMNMKALLEMAVTESVPESFLVKFQTPTLNISNQVYDWVSF